MNNIFRYFFVFFIFISSLANATAVKDGVFIDTMLLTDHIVNFLSNPDDSGSRADSFSNNDSIIFYFAIIGVINPTKKMYDVKIVCVDSKGNPVLQGTVKRSLSDFTRHVNGEIIKGYTQTLSMDPKIGAMVKDQIVPLKDGDYYINLYFENQLIGVTKFHYSIID
ncbi:hypothetical protein [Legionella worsleiensis]|uniref:Uncharacterized protein n=1 Tax=Legionella worsleiensis TaxID=45076 RepID=A0A0W1AKN1_9GAMM|nr:hypothetical protein [Legionella worsleiensis]KTD81881.1 hypothetical protein Lwor_0184 [Legionella worsleiensis]STY31169.1 Uncharacterised protein [Legionella worsleiensis]